MKKYFVLLIIPIAIKAQDVEVIETPPPPPGQDVDVVETPPPPPGQDVDVVETPPPPPGQDVNVVETPPPPPGQDVEIVETPPPPPGQDTEVASPESLPDTNQVHSEDHVGTNPLMSPEEILIQHGNISDALVMGTDAIVSKYDMRNQNSGRDPFIKFDSDGGSRDIAAVDLPTVEFLEPKMPLEGFPIDQLKLTGVIWRTESPKASFIDPTGAAHIARKNERIGTNKGYIAAIREGEVVVIEPSVQSGLSYDTTIIRIESSANQGEIK